MPSLFWKAIYLAKTGGSFTEEESENRFGGGEWTLGAKGAPDRLVHV